MNPQFGLSIIIVNWNTRMVLETCLESVYSHPPSRSFEVILVDNASQDGSPEMVRARFPQVRLLNSPKNLGFAGGNNLGLRQCSGDQVLLLNPDTEIRAGALDILLDFMDSHPRVGAAGARLLNPDGSLQYSCSPAPTLSREFARLFHLPGVRPDGYYEMSAWDLQSPRPVDILLGACLLVRREALDQVGLLSEEYFMYSEEVDLCRRIQKAGWPLYWVPQAEVVHLGGQSTRQAALEMFIHLYRSKVIYFRKHFGRSTVLGYKLLLGAASGGRLLSAPLILVQPASKRASHLALVKRYWQLVLSLLGM